MSHQEPIHKQPLPKGMKVVVISGHHRWYVGTYDYSARHIGAGDRTLCGLDMARTRYDGRWWRTVAPTELFIDPPCARCIRARDRMADR